MDNLFARATRLRLRFASDRGDLTVEQLWDLSLEKLDVFARAINADIRADTEESFIDDKPTRQNKINVLRLEILKAIIEHKQTAKKRAKDRATRSEHKKRLLAILDEKQDAKLKKTSMSKLREEIEALEDEPDEDD